MNLKTVAQRDVLIVDDDKNICEIIRDYLIHMGCFKNIVMAHDGILATQKLRNQKFALILLDINMPKKSGIDLITEFDGNNINRKECVLVVSGTLDKNIMAQIVAAGIKNFLVKPFDEAAFQDKVLKVLAQSSIKDKE
jgi:response regulator of citrate/malate metabolism